MQIFDHHKYAACPVDHICYVDKRDFAIMDTFEAKYRGPTRIFDDSEKLLR